MLILSLSLTSTLYTQIVILEAFPFNIKAHVTMYLKFITKRFLDIIPFTYLHTYRFIYIYIPKPQIKMYKNLKLSIFYLKFMLLKSTTKEKKTKKLFMSLGFVFLYNKKK